MSRTAALMASSASMLQCSFTGGRLRCFAMSLFLIVSTCRTVRASVSAREAASALVSQQEESLMACATTQGAVSDQYATDQRVVPAGPALSAARLSPLTSSGSMPNWCTTCYTSLNTPASNRV